VLLESAIESGRAGTLVPSQPVGPDGAISIPYAGRVVIAGNAPEEAQRKIEQLLANRALEPQAIVIVRRNIANSVTIVGDAVRGRRVALSPGDRLLQVIAAAGGPQTIMGTTEGKNGANAIHEVFVRLSRDGITASIPFSTLVNHPEENIFAEPGDVLTIVRRPKTLSVFGAAGKNTTITFDSEAVSLSEALAKAGGLADHRADPSAVFLFRYEPLSVVRALGQPPATGAPPDMSPIAYRLDLNDAASFLLAQRFAVHDKDIIFIADSESRKIYKILAGISEITGPIAGLPSFFNQSPVSPSSGPVGRATGTK